LLAVHGINEQSTVLEAIQNSNARDTAQDTLVHVRSKANLTIYCTRNGLNGSDSTRLTLILLMWRIW
jgi:hypothetical protein